MLLNFDDIDADKHKMINAGEIKKCMKKIL